MATSNPYLDNQRRAAMAAVQRQAQRRSGPARTSPLQPGLQSLPPQVSRPPTDLPYGGMGQPFISDKGDFRPVTPIAPPGSIGPTSQPQTMQERLARASELIGTQYGGGMGQPMPLLVDRPPVDVPKYGGGMGQPRSAEDAWRLHSAMARFAPGTDMAKEKQNFIANYNARQGVPQYGGGMGQPMTPQVSLPPELLGTPIAPPGSIGPTSQPQTMQERLARASELLGTRGGGMGQPMPLQVDRPLTDVPQYGGGMGQPYITDRGYFGPGTMSNPTGPQFGQEGVITSVNRPMPSVPQAPTMPAQPAQSGIASLGNVMAPAGNQTQQNTGMQTQQTNNAPAQGGGKLF